MSQHGRSTYSETGPSAPPRERGKLFLLVSLCFAVASGVTMLNLGMMLSDPGVEASIPRPENRNAALVREFYGAVNDAIRTGNTGSLNGIVTPDLVWCLP